MTFSRGDTVLVDGIEPGVVVAAAGDIVVVQYTRIDGSTAEATINQDLVKLRS